MHSTPSSPRTVTTPTPAASAASPRALVLGGGGSTGNAWLIGVVAALFDAGLDVTASELTIGTSAGATAAAQLSGTSPPELLAAIRAATPHSQPQSRLERGGPGRSQGPVHPVTSHLERIGRVIAAAGDAADMRRRLGAAALAMDEASDGSWSGKWRTTVASRLPSEQWPTRRVLITAVDASTGDPVVFDSNSGVDLVDAVAASCASGLPYRIGGNRYIDGGYRRNENADLAAGHGRVLVLAPFGGRSLHPPHWGMDLAAQVQELRAGGSTVETAVPDSSAEHLFGANAMDLTMRPPAAQAGYEQGKALHGRLADFWQ